MEISKSFLDSLSVISNLFTIAASAIAIFVWYTNKDKISSAFSLLLNFSFQLTLGELKEKLERLNEYNANEPSEIEEIKNIFHEISGQIQGSNRLMLAMPGLAMKFESLAQEAKGKKLTEPAKRSVVSELREKIRNIQADNFDLSAGEKP